MELETSNHNPYPATSHSAAIAATTPTREPLTARVACRAVSGGSVQTYENVPARGSANLPPPVALSGTTHSPLEDLNSWRSAGQISY
eukprot:696879-Pelagomonas_calceolata.AAC.1